MTRVENIEWHPLDIYYITRYTSFTLYHSNFFIYAIHAFNVGVYGKYAGMYVGPTLQSHTPPLPSLDTVESLTNQIYYNQAHRISIVKYYILKMPTMSHKPYNYNAKFTICSTK